MKFSRTHLYDCSLIFKIICKGHWSFTAISNSKTQEMLISPRLKYISDFMIGFKLKRKQKESSKARKLSKVNTKKGEDKKKKMEEEKSARNGQNLSKKNKAKQLATRMVLLSKEISRVQNRASQLAIQMESLSKESVEELRDILVD